MNSTNAGLLHIAACMLASVAVCLPAVWGGFALWYQAAELRLPRLLCVAVWAALGSGALLTVWFEGIGRGLGLFAPSFALLLVWWTRLRPRNDHEWADDVACISHGSVDGNLITLHNVRNFEWRSNEDYTVRWESREYDLAAMNSVDLIVSYWSGPAIAHMLLSFGFDDGKQLVFSVEIRRQKTQAFSEIGGFFKEFELSIIAADERDAIRLRTTVRREDVYLCRLQLSRELVRQLFMGYLAQANALLTTPRFYHTITVNCTTLVYQMMRRIVGHLPLSYRLLFTGYLPEYVHAVGGFDRRFTLAQLRAGGAITERAQRADRSDDFSRAIRRGMPGIAAAP